MLKLLYSQSVSERVGGKEGMKKSKRERKRLNLSTSIFHFRFLTIVGKLGSLVIGVGVGEGIADFPLPSGRVPFFIIVSGILILHI